MSAMRIRATVSGDGTLTIKGLPSMAGHTVDVLVQDRPVPTNRKCHTLRGTPVRYERPFDSVAQEDWDALE